MQRVDDDRAFTRHLSGSDSNLYDTRVLDLARVTENQPPPHRLLLEISYHSSSTDACATTCGSVSHARAPRGGHPMTLSVQIIHSGFEAVRVMIPRSPVVFEALCIHLNNHNDL